MFTLFEETAYSILLLYQLQLVDGTPDPKRQVAMQLVNLEKKMLSACLKAVDGFISDLPDHSVAPCPTSYAPLLK